jgi:hypothetical protein
MTGKGWPRSSQIKTSQKELSMSRNMRALGGVIAAVTTAAFVACATTVRYAVVAICHVEVDPVGGSVSDIGLEGVAAGSFPHLPGCA